MTDGIGNSQMAVGDHSGTVKLSILRPFIGTYSMSRGLAMLRLDFIELRFTFRQVYLTKIEEEPFT